MMYGYNGYGDWGYGHMIGGFTGGIVVIFFWVLVIVGIVWLVREVSGKHSHSAHSSSQALNILKERYARGEIDREDFETKKKDLTA